MFWSRFEALCIKHGKSPNSVAAEIGIKSSGTVTGWKNGAFPRRGVIKRIADYFEVPIEFLLGESSDVDKEKTPSYTGEQEQKKPAVNNGGLDETLVSLLVDLSPAQVQRVKDFVSGMKSSPEAQSSGSESGQQ